MKQIIIAIDGPAGSGKTTSAKLVAKRLNYIYIDTGAMYRAFALAWLNSKKEYLPEVFIELLSSSKIELIHNELGQRTYLNGNDVSDFIRTPEVTKYASSISADINVRKAMVDQQRIIGQNGGVVMDGRDIGTDVFPQAQLKIFLFATLEARAKRRTAELKVNDKEYSLSDIMSQIAERDKNDSSREVNPLRKAEDAIELDTSNLSIDEQTDIIYKLALEKINQI
jgi:cytidylate kinase